MRTALLVIATTPPYWGYAKRLMESADKFLFPHDTILFTDNPEESDLALRQFAIPTRKFPEATLFRYHVICDHLKFLREYDHLFYSDADMLFVDTVAPEEILSGGITAVEHPGFVGTIGTPETRKESTAYCPKPRTYFCGGFNGGTAQAFLNMAVDIKWQTTFDHQKGIKAIWNDESHLNRYLYDNPPARVLSPAFCYPQDANEYYKHIWEKGGGYKNVVPKLLAMTKRGI
jgi:hypothetical protein